MTSKKAVIFILVGIAIAAVPFLLRMREQQRTGQYINQFEEEENEENKETGNRKKKASPYLAEGAVGIVEVPDLEIKYPVFEGTFLYQPQQRQSRDRGKDNHESRRDTLLYGGRNAGGKSL